MQPSHPDIVVVRVDEDRPLAPRRVLAYAGAAGLFALSLSLCEAMPPLALVLALLGLLAVALGQVKGPAKKSLRSSLRAAAMVSARMDSIPDSLPPSTRGRQSKR